MIEYVLGIFELLIAAFEIAVDGVLLAIVHACVFQRVECVIAMIAVHIEILTNSAIIVGGDLCASNGQCEVIAMPLASAAGVCIRWRSGCV